MFENINDDLVPLQDRQKYIWYFSDGAYNKNLVLQTLIDKGRSIFDGDIQSYPIPNDAPVEFPRVLVRSQAGDISANSTPERILIDRITNGPATDHILTSDRNLVSEVFSGIQEAYNGRVSRIAYHRHRAVATDDPAMKLVEYFCKKELISIDTNPRGPLSRCESFEIHAHKTYELIHGLTINSWIRCKTAKTTKGNKPAYVIEQDLNTMKEEMNFRDFDSIKSLDVFSKMHDETDSIFDLYFPDGMII